MSSPPQFHASPSRRWRMVLLKSAVFVLVLLFVTQSLRNAVEELERADWRFDPFSAAFSGVFYILGLLPAGIYWWWLLGKLGQLVAPLDAIQAYFVGHLGKYVPGKAMVVVLRAGIMRSAGASAAIAGLAVVAETLTMMACGAVLAVVLVAALVPPDWKLPLAAALAVATGGPTLPPVLNRILTRMQPQAAAEPSSRTAVALDWRTAAVGWIAMLLVWALTGMSLIVLLRGLDSELVLSVEHYLLATAAVALATVAGFLSLLPGGLVVRELILLDLLAPVVGDATALVAAVLLRLVWLIAELGVAGALSAAVRIRRAKQDGHS